jgi:glycosyltransferase involved in cell wall biosynthesis
LRIALVSTFRARCGIATHTLDLSEALTDKGIDVLVVAEVKSAGLDETQTTKVPYERVFDRKDSSSWDKIVPAAKLFGADILHVQHEGRIFPGDSFRRIASQAKKNGIKVVVTFHSIPYFRDRALISPLASMLDLALSYTEEGLRSLRAAGFRHAEFIPHGVREYQERSVPEARRAMDLNLESFIFSSSGFIGGPKGLVETLEVLKRVQGRIPDATFIHAGGLNPTMMQSNRPYLAYLDNMIKQLGIRSSDFILTGYVPDNLLPVYGQASDMIVLNYYPSGVVSASGTFARAGVSLYRPIITVDGTIRIEEALHGETCWKVPFNSPDKMAEAIVYLYDHPEIQKRLVEGQRKYVMQNNWHNVAHRHIQLYNRLLEQPFLDERQLYARDRP